LLDALEPLALGGVALHLEAVEVALALFGRQHEVGSDRQRRRCARGYGGGLLPGSTAAAPRRDRDRDVGHVSVGSPCRPTRAWPARAPHRTSLGGPCRRVSTGDRERAAASP